MESVTLLLSPGEAEGFVRSLQTFSLKEMGSPRWFRQHEYIEKLYMQAIVASFTQDEFIKELLVSHGKIPTLVHEMILVEVWKQKVFPILCQLRDFDPKSTFPLYMVIRHEVSIINLLETVMYHKDSCEAAGDSVLDLVDYCHRKLTLLVGRASKDDTPKQDRLNGTPSADLSSIQELQGQNTTLEFDISLKALSVLRYITDHTDSISVISRMLCTHNLPCVLVQLVENCPWSRYTAGEVEKYTAGGKWQKIPPEDRVKMTKLDGHVWIALYNLLLKEDCQRKYDFHNYNKNQLMKGYREIVCILAGKCILEVYDDYKITPLFVAAQYGQQECLQILIDAGANVNAQAWDLATPLMLASQEGHEGCVDVLLTHGADPNLACHGEWPQLPIHAAAQFGHISILAKLITVTDRACDRGESSVSPLYMAVVNGQSHAVELLLREGFSPDGQNCNSVFGSESPLSYALRDNRSVCVLSESVRLLLAVGASLNQEVWIYAICTHKPEQLQQIIQQRSISRPEQLSKSINISGPEEKSRSMFTPEELSELLYVALNTGLRTALYWLPSLLQAGLEPSLFLQPIMLKKAEPEVLSYFLEFQNWSTLPRPLLDILDQRRTQNTWTPRSHQVSLPSLSHLCRLQIRVMLGSETLMQTAVVQQLPLPPPLQTYLQFTDILPPSQTCLHPHP